MHVSAKTEYACLAVFELALSYDSGEPVQVRRLATAHGIPSRFLVQILLQLKNAGLVSSTRGAAGGYRLIRSPEEVTVLEVMEAIDGREVSGFSHSSPQSPTASALFQTWATAAERQREVLSNTSFAELCKQAAETTEDMYYI